MRRDLISKVMREMGRGKNTRGRSHAGAKERASQECGTSKVGED